MRSPPPPFLMSHLTLGYQRKSGGWGAKRYSDILLAPNKIKPRGQRPSDGFSHYCVSVTTHLTLNHKYPDKVTFMSKTKQNKNQWWINNSSVLHGMNGVVSF